MPSRIAFRRLLAKAGVSVESRVEALEDQVAALTAETKSKKPSFRNADAYDRMKDRIAAARDGGA